MSRMWTCACLILTILAAGNVRRGAAQSLEEIRGRALAPILMDGLDPTAAEAKAAVADLDRSVADLLATQITTPGAAGYGGWDPDMTINSDEVSYNGTYFRRTLRLARAWACPASEYCHSTEVAGSLNLAMERALPLLEVHQRPDNWWAWDIGIPNRLGETLLYASDALSASTRSRSLTEQEYLTKKTVQSVSGGANSAWTALVQMRTALVTNKTSYLDLASVAMSQLIERSTAIQPDYSYFFHGDGLNIGYGFSHWDAVARFARLTDGTSWALTPVAQQKVVDWTNDFFVQNAWQGMWSPWTLGRARTRPYGDDGMSIMRPTETMDARSIVRPLLEMANSNWPQAQRDLLFGAAMEHIDGIASPYDDPAIYYLWQNSNATPAAPSYDSHYFPYTDYLTARRPDWYATVRLNSTRTLTWFTLAGENLLGHETAEGALALMTDPKEFAYDVLVTMPYDDLPGVTRQTGLKRTHDTKGEATQTAGAAVGEYAVASFDYRLTGTTKNLSANKSYFTLPGAVVMMGSDIRSTGSDEVTTTLYTVPNKDGRLMIDGAEAAWTNSTTPVSGARWLYVGNVGVVPLESMDCELAVQAITANSTRINTLYVTDETYTNQFATVRVRHGVNPDGGSYAAVLLPAASPEQVADFAAAPTIRVAANTAEAHVITMGDGLTAAALFAPQQVHGVLWADGPVDVLCRRDQGTATLSAMVSPGSAFSQSIARKIWLPGGFDLSQLPGEVVDAHVRDGGISFTLQIKTGEAFEMSLPTAALGPPVHTIDFNSPHDLTSQFYAMPAGGGGFSYDAVGIGSDGQPGRLTFSSNGGSGTDIAVYDWLPDAQPGPDNRFEDFRISVDVKFASGAGGQFFGIAFNIDDDRADGLSNKDCLVLQLRNVDQASEPVDQWRLRHSALENANWGDTLAVRAFPDGLGIPQQPDDGATDWLRLILDVDNDIENGLSLTAQLIDLATSVVIDSWTLEDLDYAADLNGAAARGEIGLLANDSLGYNSVKVDRFVVDVLPPVVVPGDANRDGRVNEADAMTLAAHWGRAGGWTDGDFDGDGVIGPGDASILAANWGCTKEGTTSLQVPEPGAIAMLAGGMVILLSSTGRRRNELNR